VAGLTVRRDVGRTSSGPSVARCFDTKSATPTAGGGRSPSRPRRSPSSRPFRKSNLSPARQWLVEAMQRIGYGRLKHLVIVGGDPLVNPRPRLYRDQRLTGPNAGRRESHLADFILKESVVRLFEEFDRIGNGTVARLEVRDGLPYGMTLEESGPP
jgi:hypothetical protein